MCCPLRGMTFWVRAKQSLTIVRCGMPEKSKPPVLPYLHCISKLWSMSLVEATVLNAPTSLEYHTCPNRAVRHKDNVNECSKLSLECKNPLSSSHPFLSFQVFLYPGNYICCNFYASYKIFHSEVNIKFLLPLLVNAGK
ncbi:hypothetical protein HJG60_011256 [Phyllostomus discolor]|uniref:Uncharacterized protein n=1 Tax=Phyllostomus discolor TaxID=89673 RepID=A0A834A7A6_9CHIR|nr:hypothetical protein HJG60_011256 [Phyllostomus discolor]